MPMKKIMCFLLVMLLIISLSTSISAQEELPKYQAYYIVDDLVNPSKVSEYELALKEYIAHFKENNYPYSIHLFSTNDFHYYYSTPIALSFAEIDSLYKYLNKVAAANPDKWDATWKKFDGTYEYNKAGTMLWYRDLSYEPENPRLEANDEAFSYLVFIYLKVGKSPQFRELLNKWNELYKSKGITDRYSIYRGEVGYEQPCYIWQFHGKDHFDFWSEAKNNHELLGLEAKELWEETLKLVRKIEYRYAWYRPDLSYSYKK
ncbi:MAG: hypothetical protein C0597_13125 [Marinilabiliales bacterium]|nr:MAG: hypothetical protein C0597_13125 [Marinilabiliales bacterium]